MVTAMVIVIVIAMVIVVVIALVIICCLKRSTALDDIGVAPPWNAVDVDAVVEECIDKLLSVKCMRPGTEVVLPAEDIAIVVKRAREVFLAQPMLLEVCLLVFLCIGRGQGEDIIFYYIVWEMGETGGVGLC